MGTSSSYPGPTGSNPLLPPWAEPLPPEDPQPPENPQPPEDPPPPVPPEENPDNPQPLPPQPPKNPDSPDAPDGGGSPVVCPGPALPVPSPPLSWGTAKRSATNWARGKAGYSAGRVARDFTRAHGGSRTAAHTARAGRQTSAVLGGFLASVARSGIVEAVRRLGLQNVVGRDAMTVLAAIIDQLAPDGALRDEAPARNAVIETLTALYERFDVAENGLQSLDAMGEADVRDLVVLSVASFVNEQFQQELLSCVERNAVSESRANELASEMREFIFGITALDLARVEVLALDWTTDGQRIVSEIYRSAYSFLEKP